jgi:hypothetical protein
MKRTLLALCAVALAAGCGGAKAETAGGKAGIGTAVEGANLERIDSNKRCETGGGREVLVDLNQDGKADVRKIYTKSGEVEILSCREADLNFDRKLDVFVYFDEAGVVKRDELDLDFDGAIEIITLYSEGKVVRQDIDTNSDGQVDRVRTISNDKPQKVEGDTNADGKIDYWEYYNAAGTMIRAGLDTDSNGSVDVWWVDAAAAASEESQESAAEEGAPEADGEKTDGKAAQ